VRSHSWEFAYRTSEESAFWRCSTYSTAIMSSIGPGESKGRVTTCAGGWQREVALDADCDAVLVLRVMGS
jgi:hypothetical protein